MTLEIKEGKFYRTRDGRKYGPMYRGPDAWGADGCGAWRDDGSAYYPWSADSPELIAEWTEETGTLAELDVKPGDVVEFVKPLGGTEVVNEKYVGMTYTVDKDGFAGGFMPENHNTFRILRRAPTGPVITETVKRIVPGVYGKVVVEERNKGEIIVSMNIEMPSLSELLAAIATLQQIADAMGEAP